MSQELYIYLYIITLLHVHINSIIPIKNGKNLMTMKVVKKCTWMDA